MPSAQPPVVTPPSVSFARLQPPQQLGAQGPLPAVAANPAHPPAGPLRKADLPSSAEPASLTPTSILPTPASPPVSPPPDPATPQPAPSRHLPHGLAPSLAHAVTHTPRDTQVELTLHPVELGKLRFEITTTNDRTQINILVERPDTLDLLRRHADILRAEFRAAGFDGATLNFSQWARQGHDPSAHHAALPDFDSENATPPDALPKRTLNTAGQGLDLRL